MDNDEIDNGDDENPSSDEKRRDDDYLPARPGQADEEVKEARARRKNLHVFLMRNQQ